MTEPPRPPGAGGSDLPSDPTAPLDPSPSGSTPPAGSPPPAHGSPPPGQGSPPPAYGSPPPGQGSWQPPVNDAPPTSGAGGYPPPGSGAGGYATGGPAAGGYPPGGPPPPYGHQQPPPPYGNQQPPPYGYQPQPGYPAGGYPANDDKTWILVAHFGGAAGALLGGGAGGWLAPLVALLARGNQSPLVRAHAVAALNFQILWSIVALVGWILTCVLIGFAIVGVAWLVAVIVGVIAGAKASNGEAYAYPMSISLIK